VSEVAAPPREEIEARIERALRAEWRMIERVILRRSDDGCGYRASIQLNQTLVRGAAEQQGLGRSPAGLAAAEARRASALAACVQRINAGLAPADSIRGFQVLG
jgi:hypothetical protein